MRVILARHGNTFAAGQAAVWVGARTDLPLVAKGREQAAMIGRALSAANLVPRLTVAGPLLRTQETARLALWAADAADTIEVEPKLREIDYGLWEGRTSDEIRAMGWSDDLEGWEKENSWPSRGAWPGSAAVYVAGIFDVLDEVGRRTADPTLIVSSNGVFKLFAASLKRQFGGGKMSTGHLSLLHLEGKEPVVLCWNLAPDAFVEWTRENLT